MRTLLLALLLLPCIAAAQAGRFLLAVGEVAVVRGGGEFRPAAGTPVHPGDLIRLGARSNAQIRLSDESIIALRAGTEMRIDAYAYSGRAEESRSFFSLVRGGLRTVTGAIGALHDRERYRVKTPTATIGIRGTHYVLVHCDNDCGAGAQSGTYGGVSDGRIGVENQTGERQFGVQEFFHVASADAAPQGLIAPPAFLYDRLEGQERSRGRQGAETSENMARAGLDAESRPSDVPAPPEPPAFIVTEQRDEQGNPIVLTTLSVVGGIAFSTPDIADMQESVSQSLTFDATGTRLEAFSATNLFGDSVSVSRGAAAFADTGGDAGGDVFWGRWTPGASASVLLGDDPSGIPQQLTPPTGIHWLFGNATAPAVVAAKTGSVPYAYFGGTNPTDDSGAAGTMDGTNSAFTVDFTGRSVSGNLAYTVGGVTYAIPVSAGITLMGSKAIFADVRDGPDVIGTCTACGGLIDLTSVGGTFYGASAGGLGVTFATDDATAGATAGAAHFAAAGSVPPTTGIVLALTRSTTGAGDDPAGFVQQSDMTTSGSGTSRALQAFTIPTGSHVDPAEPTMSGSAGTPGNVINQTVANALNAYWGRWIGGSMTDADGTTTFASGNQLHYIVGPLTPPDVIAAKSGTFGFNLVQSTTPTNNIGETATAFSAGPLSVDFTARTVSWPVTTFTFPSQNWSFPTTSSSINIDARGAFTDNNITGSCGPATGCSGTARLVRTGVFMGPAGDHLGVSFQARTTSGAAASMQASGIFACTPPC